MTVARLGAERPSSALHPVSWRDLAGAYSVLSCAGNRYLTDTGCAWRRSAALTASGRGASKARKIRENFSKKKYFLLFAFFFCPHVMDKQQIMTWAMRLLFILTEVFLVIVMIVSFAQTKSYLSNKEGMLATRSPCTGVSAFVESNACTKNKVASPHYLTPHPHAGCESTPPVWL